MLIEKNNFKIMGILNLTPDSFSDGGKYLSNEKANAQISDLVRSGADILDIGAESTGPSSGPITIEEELKRLEIVFLNTENLKNIIISIDTYKSQVASWALDRGVKIINDISALRADPQMVEVVSSFNCEIIAMYARYSKRFPHASSETKEYDSIYDTILAFFDERINFLISKGVREELIILDPGMGAFLSPNKKYSWQVVKFANDLKKHYPKNKILYGVSRKGFIADSCNKENLDFASKFVELKLLESGVDIIRTHNVAMLKEVLLINNNLNNS